MNTFALTCESTADRTAGFFESRDIRYVCFHYEVGDETFSADLYA